MSGMMAHGKALRRRERPPPPPPPHLRRSRYRHRCRRQLYVAAVRWQSRPRSVALPFDRGRGARSCNARGRSELFLTIYLKCTLFSHQGGGTGSLLIDAHCTRHAEARGRGARRREEEKNTTLRGTAKLAPPRRNAVLVLSASGLPTARFRRCAALPCVASRRVYVAVRASGAAHALGAPAHAGCAGYRAAGRSNGACGRIRVRSAATFAAIEIPRARASSRTLFRSSVIPEENH